MYSYSSKNKLELDIMNTSQNLAPIDLAYNEYLEALKAGSSHAATEAIDKALAQGVSPSKIYLKVLLPAQLEMGELWHSGKSSISEEHLATQIALSEMTRLRHLIQPKSSLGLKAVVATIDGDAHFLGGKVVADFLFMDGWEVDFLGTNTPSEDLVKFVKTRGVNLVGLSITLTETIPELERAVRALKALEKPPKIMLGGPAVERAPESVIKQLAPDAVAHDAKQAVEEARKICGLLGSHASLNQYLRGMGARILEARKLRKMSQQDLADGSGLDRAYISSVENGKQNVTIGAVFKLADALDIALEDLLVGSGRQKQF